MKDDKITHDEIIELFGGEIPMEAVDILFNGPADMTVAEAREKITALAKTWKIPTTDLDAAAIERLAQRFYEHNRFPNPTWEGLSERSREWYLSAMRETVELVPRAKLADDAGAVEYICKCGLRVEPHRCADTTGGF